MISRLKKIAQRAKNKPSRPLDGQLPELIERYLQLSTAQNRPHDSVVRITIEQAFLAANLGNFGVGAVIVDAHGRVIQRGHARVLRPYLRTDLHAEMHAINCVEERHAFHSRQELDNVLAGSTLFSSLEPCPMCFSRWILSGVTNVYYAAPEPRSGMVSVADKLPAVWLEIIKDRGKSHGQADCSDELSRFAAELFIQSAIAGGRDPQWQWK